MNGNGIDINKSYNSGILVAKEKQIIEETEEFEDEAELVSQKQIGKYDEIGSYKTPVMNPLSKSVADNNYKQNELFYESNYEYVKSNDENSLRNTFYNMGKRGYQKSKSTKFIADTEPIPARFKKSTSKSKISKAVNSTINNLDSLNDNNNTNQTVSKPLTNPDNYFNSDDFQKNLRTYKSSSKISRVKSNPKTNQASSTKPYLNVQERKKETSRSNIYSNSSKDDHEKIDKNLTNQQSINKLSIYSSGSNKSIPVDKQKFKYGNPFNDEDNVVENIEDIIKLRNSLVNKSQPIAPKFNNKVNTNFNNWQDKQILLNNMNKSYVSNNSQNTINTSNTKGTKNTNNTVNVIGYFNSNQNSSKITPQSKPASFEKNSFISNIYNSKYTKGYNSFVNSNNLIKN